MLGGSGVLFCEKTSIAHPATGAEDEVHRGWPLEGGVLQEVALMQSQAGLREADPRAEVGQAGGQSCSGIAVVRCGPRVLEPAGLGHMRTYLFPPEQGRVRDLAPCAADRCHGKHCLGREEGEDVFEDFGHE